MKKRLLHSFIFTLALSLIFGTICFAKSAEAKKSLVALGDSIPFGYNLGNNNEHPSRLAYPYIMGDEANLRVRDLGVPGWTSSQLLNAVKSDEKYQEAVRHADYITMSIGNNDLLAALRKAGNDPTALQAELASTLPALFDNLEKTIATIRELSDAPVVIYNIYNPFQPTNQPLNGLAATLLNNPDPSKMDVNDLISQQVSYFNSKYRDIHLADAYSAYGNSGMYVRVGDIHPTALGQEVLAEIGLESLGLK